MQLLIDENLSPKLVQFLAEKGLFAQHVAHIGLAGWSDPAIWRHAFEQDRIVVTNNAADYITLASAIELHPGLIVIRESGLTRDQQWQWLERVVDNLLGTGETLINGIVEIWDVGHFEIRDLPPE